MAARGALMRASFFTPRSWSTLGWLPLVAGLVASCSVAATPIHGRDGKPYQYLSCGGPFLSLSDCYAKANEVCPNGYRIADGVAPRGLTDSNVIIVCSS